MSMSLKNLNHIREIVPLMINGYAPVAESCPKFAQAKIVKKKKEWYVGLLNAIIANTIIVTWRSSNLSWMESEVLSRFRIISWRSWIKRKNKWSES